MQRPGLSNKRIELASVFHRVWQALGPRDCWDPEKLRVGGAVRVLGISFLIVLAPAAYLQWMHGWAHELWTLAASALLAGTSLRLNGRGQTEWAARMLTAAGLVCASGMIYFSGSGYRDLSLLLFPAIL